jgi:hypothetical protein
MAIDFIVPWIVGLGGGVRIADVGSHRIWWGKEEKKKMIDEDRGKKGKK